MKKLAFLLYVFGALGAITAEATITVTSVKQRWPFSGKVDVNFTLASSEPQDILFNFTYMGQLVPQNVTNRWLDATVYGATNGMNHFVFDPADYGLSDVALPNLTFTPVWATNVSERLYIVLDGPTSSYEFLKDTPVDGWTQTVYKTQKTPFRRVSAGTYQLGNTDAELKAVLGRNASAAEKRSMGKRFVTLSCDYYIALFPLTYGQENYLRGTTSSRLESYQSSYAYFRGNTNGTDATMDVNWPHTGVGQVLADSWVDTVNRRFGNKFALDLPTDAQFEVAIRAGTTTIFFNGGDENSTKDELERLWLEFSCPSSPGKEDVGLRSPNQWNIYNPQGMNQYWCLDAVSTTEVGWKDNINPGPEGFDPIGDVVLTGCPMQRVAHGNGYSSCGAVGWRRCAPPDKLWSEKDSKWNEYKVAIRPAIHLADPRER